MTDCIPQLLFSFYHHQPIRADFSGGQITSDAGLLPLRSFDQRHHLTRELAAQLNDPRQDDRVHHDSLALLRQRIYQIVAGYEDANDADRLRHDPLLQIVADQKLGVALGSQPTLSRWENAPSARELVRLNDLLREQFIRLCGDQVRKRGEILLDLDSTDDPTHGQQQLSFFNGAYDQHMYHPMLIFERHTGCLLAARLRPGNASSHARIVPMLLRLVPRLQSAFPGVKIQLRGDAGFALPLLYEFCEFFGIQYAFGIPANCVFQQRAEPRQKQLKRRYRRTQLPQRSFSSFHHRARSWPRQRRICYKAEHTAVGTNLRFVITNCPGRASEVFAFYNDRGECENRIEEFKNGFRADLRGLELLQAEPGETEDAAWIRMKGKLGSGKELEQTRLFLPNAYPQSGGKLPFPEPPTTPQPSTTPPPPGSATPPNIFGGTGSTPPPPAPTVKPFGAPPKTPMNLLGEVEKWGIGAATNVTNVNINVSQMTGAQLTDLLKKLPDGVTYALNLEKESE